MIGTDVVFIDKKKGTPIYPKAIRMDDDSIGKFHVEQLFFISKSDSVYVSMDMNPVFFFIDMESFKEGNVLDDVKSYVLTLTGENIDGSNWKLYNIYICSKSDGEGSYSIDMKIDNDNIEVSSDFYGEREEYSILLHNQGVNIPKDISRVFPSTDIHDNSIDWMLLNRKYKELLMNAVDIIYKKGSYKSLLASLDWFEYGDMLKLREYWSTPEMIKLHERELTTIYSDTIREMMKMYTKTTFVSLVLSADMILTEDGKTIYDIEDGECTVPILSSRELQWGMDDMMLKMTLLGNYFSTYFLPIHLDLLYSSIERTVFTSPAKMKQRISPDHTSAYIYDDTSRLVIDGVKDRYIIGDAYYAAGHDTLLSCANGVFGIQVMNSMHDSDAYKNNDISTEEWSPEFSNGINIGAYAVIPLAITPKSNKDIIYTSLCVSFIDVFDGRIINNIVTPIAIVPNENISINILIHNEGSYTIGINLIGNEGTAMAGKVKVKVETPESNHFEFVPMSRLILDDIDIKDIYNNAPLLAFVDNIDNDTTKDCKYPDSMMNWVFPFSMTENGIDIYNSKGIAKHFDSPEDIHTEMLTGSDWIDKGLYYVVWVSVDGGWRVYIIDMRSGNKSHDIRIDNIKGEFRLIPFLWKDTDTDPRKISKDDIVRLIPHDILVSGYDFVWRIMNCSTGETGYVRHSSTPMISGCNNGDISNDVSVGLYSVDLFVKYPNGIYTKHTRKNIYRIS